MNVEHKQGHPVEDYTAEERAAWDRYMAALLPDEGFTIRGCAETADEALAQRRKRFGGERKDDRIEALEAENAELRGAVKLFLDARAALKDTDT